MLHALKNIGIRLWATLLLGGLMTLVILALIGSPTRTVPNLLITALTMLLIFTCSGWVLNRIGLNWIQLYLDQAVAQERNARVRQAANSFRQAVYLFDSCLLSPFFRARLSRRIAGRIARFHMARPDKDREAEDFLFSYLSTHPDDTEVAEFWIKYLTKGGAGRRDYADLADAISWAQADNSSLQNLLAEYFIGQGRTDYNALQTYNRVLHQHDNQSVRFISRLADLFLREGRADEFALGVYLQAYRQDSTRVHIINGLAACSLWVRENEASRPYLEITERLLSRFDHDQRQQMASHFVCPEVVPARAAVSVGNVLRNAGIGALALLRHIATTILACGSRLSAAVQNCSEWMVEGLRRSRARQQALKWTGVSILALLVGLALISTMRHLLNTTDSIPPPVAIQKAVPISTGRYTIQVASFLNPDLAKGLSEKLSAAGQNARWGESRGAGDKVWYHVRISRFESKQEAKIFGDSLKSEGVIDDFFVANY